MVEFRVLGPVEAVDEGHAVPLPAAKPRAVLALLLLARGRVVPVDALVDDLWGETPPDTAVKALQGYISQLRKALGQDRILTRPPGYTLQLAEGELDLDRFERLTAAGRAHLAAGRPELASEPLHEALALWRGPPLAEFDAERFAREARSSLEALRRGVVEDRIEADLQLGRHASLIPELQALRDSDPFRERTCEQLMLALYRSGRQAEALEVFRVTRERLVEELGIEPGQRLQEVHRRMLRQDPLLDTPLTEQPRPAQPVTPRRRKRVLLGFGSAAAALLLAAVVAALALDRDPDQPSAAETGGAAYVIKLENFLAQSREGRREISHAIEEASRCRLSRREALTRLNRVQRNRQSVLQQLAALAVPETDEALRASDLLQQAIQASIAADWLYHDWLRNRAACEVRAGDPNLSRARAADDVATRAKQRFVAVFNRLARMYSQRPWAASEF